MSHVVNFDKEEPCEVYVGRTSKWGNPFHIGIHGDRSEVLLRFENYVFERPALMKAMRRELSGKVLGCHCSPLPCHGDLIARIANNWQMI